MIEEKLWEFVNLKMVISETKSQYAFMRALLTKTFVDFANWSQARYVYKSLNCSCDFGDTNWLILKVIMIFYLRHGDLRMK